MQLLKFMPAAMAIPYIVLPLFPLFITLAPVAVPGVSLLPYWFSRALLACMVLRGLYFGV